MERMYFDLRDSAFKGRLLVCDMDGTLLDSSSKVSAENKKALDRFVAGGGLFAVATGRMEKSVQQYLDVLPINMPVILYNGAMLYDFKEKRILWRADLDPAVAGPVRDVLRQFPDVSVQVYHGGNVYLASENIHSYEHMIRENLEPVRLAMEEVPQPWIKFILAWDPPKLREVEEFLSRYEVPFRQVYSEPQFLELLNPDATKGSALKELIRLSGLEKSRIISMGDNPNDIEMIEEAGTGIAVDNAHSALKAVADMCCTDNNSNAVSEVISWIETGKISC